MIERGCKNEVTLVPILFLAVIEYCKSFASTTLSLTIFASVRLRDSTAIVKVVSSGTE